MKKIDFLAERVAGAEKEYERAERAAKRALKDKRSAWAEVQRAKDAMSQYIEGRLERAKGRSTRTVRSWQGQKDDRRV